jgi:peroxiredoxin family protein
VHQRVSIGLSAQLVLTKFTFHQTLYSGLSTPRRQADEDPLFDSTVNVELPLAVNPRGHLPGMTAVATAMMKGMMARAKMPTVEEMLDLCVEADVQLFACATTMGVMGIRQADLIPHAKCAGAGTFLDYAADADVSLFV